MMAARILLAIFTAFCAGAFVMFTFSAKVYWLAWKEGFALGSRDRIDLEWRSREAIKNEAAERLNGRPAMTDVRGVAIDP